jgi:hypothetical protein
MRGIPRQAVDKNTPIKNSSSRAAEIANLPDSCSWYGGLTGVNMTRPGGQDYYNSLFELYSSWGVDYIKVDDIASPYHAEEIEGIRKAIDKCGRAIILSLSPGPAPIGSAAHLSRNANLWRISGDFWDNWKVLKDQLHLIRAWAPYVTEGHWPDPDMLPLGRLNIRTEMKNGHERETNFTKEEQYFLMTLWFAFRAPLMFGGNMPDNDEFTLSLLTNREALRVDQFSSNNKELIFRDGISIWISDDKQKPVKYLAVLNTTDKDQILELPVASCGLKGALTVNDLWGKKMLPSGEKGYSVNVPAHGGRLYSVAIK